MEEKDFERTRQALRKKTEAILDGDPFMGVRTGYQDLDTGILGLRNGDLVVVGGRPAMGKTAFALNLIENVAIGDDKGCLYFTLEDSVQRLMERLLREVSRIDFTKELDESEKKRIKKASEKIETAPVIFEYAASASIEKICSEAKEYSSRNEISLIIVDYLQLLAGAKDTVREDIEYSMRLLKELALELECPVVVLSQLNRTVERRPEHRPILCDLKGSGSIEDIADLVLLLYRDEYYYCDSERKGIMEVFVAKSYTGQNRLVELAYVASYGRIFSLER